MKNITKQELEAVIKKSFFSGWKAGLEVMREGANTRYSLSKQDIENQTARKLADLVKEITDKYKEIIIT